MAKACTKQGYRRKVHALNAARAVQEQESDIERVGAYWCDQHEAWHWGHRGRGGVRRDREDPLPARSGPP